MTPEEATDLATRMAQTWRNGVPAREWESELAELDAGRAGTVFARLRRESDNAPTIAGFLAKYRSLGPMPNTGERYADCDECGNHGWRTLWATDGDGREYSPGVEPCRCRWGQERRTAHQAAIDANAAELDRLFPHRHQKAHAKDAA